MAGRPKRQFSDEQVQEITDMALNNCNTETIANALSIPVNTLKRHFGRLLKLKRAEHRVNLRKAQGKAVKDGNPSILIFLGKNELNQTDKQIITDDRTDNAVISKEDEAMYKAMAEEYKERKSRQGLKLREIG